MDKLIISLCGVRPKEIKVLAAPNPPTITISERQVILKPIASKVSRRAEGNGGVNSYVRTGVADIVFNSVSETSEFSENIWIGDYSMLR